jgi:hypothetical protein
MHTQYAIIYLEWTINQLRLKTDGYPNGKLNPPTNWMPHPVNGQKNTF